MKAQAEKSKDAVKESSTPWLHLFTDSNVPSSSTTTITSTAPSFAKFPALHPSTSPLKLLSVNPKKHENAIKPQAGHTTSASNNFFSATLEEVAPHFSPYKGSLKPMAAATFQLNEIHKKTKQATGDTNSSNRTWLSQLPSPQPPSKGIPDPSPEIYDIKIETADSKSSASISDEKLSNSEHAKLSTSANSSFLPLDYNSDSDTDEIETVQVEAFKKIPTSSSNKNVDSIPEKYTTHCFSLAPPNASAVAKGSGIIQLQPKTLASRTLTPLIEEAGLDHSISTFPSTSHMAMTTATNVSHASTSEISSAAPLQSNPSLYPYGYPTIDDLAACHNHSSTQWKTDVSPPQPSMSANVNSSLPHGKEWKDYYSAEAKIEDLKAEDLQDKDWVVGSETYDSHDALQKRLSVVKALKKNAGGTQFTYQSDPLRPHKRKHQINWLAHEAVEREAELLERTAHTRQSKYQTQMKYGW